MTSEPQRPETIERLGRAIYPSLAMLAGMELDLFTPLKDVPMTNRQLADALDINSGKLRPLLYSLVAAGLLEVAARRRSRAHRASHRSANPHQLSVALRCKIP